MKNKQFNSIFLLLLAILAGWLLPVKWFLNILNPEKNVVQKQETAPVLQDDSALSQDDLEKIKKRPYDDESFHLLYQTLLYNSNIKKAYELAQIALAKNPKNFGWHKKLAQTAMWVGDYDTAMKEWLYVALHTKKIKTIKEAAANAKILGYNEVLVDILKIYIKQDPQNQNLALQLAQAQNRTILPEQALLTLEKINGTRASKSSYELTAMIYQDRGQWGKALEIWQRMDRDFGPNLKSLTAQAVIYYSRGQLDQALSVLKKGIAVADVKDKQFWESLGSLAWMTNDKPLAILALSRDLNDSSHLLRLIELEGAGNPEQALYYSAKGWDNFHQPLFFSYSLQFAEKLKKWCWINDLFLNLSRKQLEKMENIPAFWLSQANLYGAFGEKYLQKQVFIEGLLSHPDMLQLKVNFLWFLIANGESPWIKALMNEGYQQNRWNDPLLWHAYAAGFLLLNQVDTAVYLYQQHLFDNFQDDQIVIDYARLLERKKLYQQSSEVWGYLWQRTLMRLRQETPFAQDSLLAVSQIASRFVSGTDQIRIFNALLQEGMDDQTLNILLGWMTPRNYFDLMSWFKGYYMNNSLPDWAEINLALMKNDLPALQKILEQRAKALPGADRINAAIRLENTPLALDLAFAELSERPDANEIYSTFVQQGVSDANFTSLAGEYEQFVNVVGPRTKLETKFRLSNTWKMQPALIWWKLRSKDSAQITNLPYEDFQARMRLEQTIAHGKITWGLDYRKALSEFVPVSMNINYQLNAKWRFRGKLGYSQENFINSYMRIGGLQDQLSLGFIKNVTKYDSLMLEWEGFHYYSQDRHYLANGFNVHGLYQHKFWLSYPDYTLGLFANSYNYNRNGSFGGNITTLFPELSPIIQSNPLLLSAAIDAEYQSLIPNNYYEGGFTFGFGSEIVDYVHSWRPYLLARLYYNTITFLSNDIKFGFNGSVFGSDSLLFYMERGTAQSVQNSTNYIFGMRYKLYY